MMISGWRRLVPLILLSLVGLASPVLAIRQVQAILVDTDKVNIQLDKTVSVASQERAGINVLRLVNPNRVVVDLDNAQVAEDAVIPVNREGIQRIELRGNRSPIHNSARITLVVDDSRANQTVQTQQTVDGLTLSFSPGDMLKWVHGGNAPLVSTKPVATSYQGVVPGPADRTLVSGIDFSNGQILINGNGPFRIKNRFVLHAPNRLVVDLDHAVLANRSLLGSRSFADPNITQVRLGQFDDATVRVTIQAENPARLQVAQTHSGTLAIGTGNTPAEVQPVEVAAGFLQNIYLDNQNGGTQIRVHTSVPMKQKISRVGDTLQIDMDNIAAVTGTIRYNQSDFPQVKRMWIESKGDGSRINVALASDNHRMQTALFSAKKILEVSLNDGQLAAVPPGRLPSGRMRVVIDAGHGGKDLGANREGINEKDLNLAVAHRLRQALEARGVRVSMTRSTDMFLPLPEITSINNSISPDVFVSVHTNSSTNPGITGIETYFYTPQSIPLANRVHAQLVNRIKSPDRGVRQARFYVIHHTQVPAILCEMGYISNPAERYSLTTPDRQDATANAIADGVVDYLKTRLTANQPVDGTDDDAAPPPPTKEPLVIVPDAPEAPIPVLEPAAMAIPASSAIIH